MDIRPVRKRPDLTRFITFPWRVYREDPHWVPPLIRDRRDFLTPAKNPFYEHSDVELFLARRGGDIVGRIAAFVNHNHNRFHGEQVGFFGLFEVIPDFTVAEGLLSTARDWLAHRGVEVLRGPANFSSNDEWGLLVEGFDSPPTIMMPYNPPHYLEFFDKFGLVKAKDLLAYYMDKSTRPPDRLVRMAERVRRREGIAIHSLDMKRFPQEVEKVMRIYNAAWERNWGFVPMTEAEFHHMAKVLKSLVVPALVLIAEVDGEPAGFSLALPDYNQALKRINGRLFPLGLFKLLYYARKIDLLRIITMGVVPRYRRRGIESIFYVETYKRGMERGYTRGEMSWILEDNVMMNRALKTLGARVYKRYRIYEMAI